MKAVVIEDEINVREGFIKMLNAFCPEVTVVATAENVEKGIELVNRQTFDLLFLDINLPDGSGFDLMHRVQNRDFKLIFVTAYDKYAIDAFKLSAVDYLLKPVSPDLLNKAIQKVKDVTQKAVNQAQLEVLNTNLLRQVDQTNKIVLRDQDSLHLIQVKDIVYCRAEGSYTTFVLTNGTKIMTSLNLKEYENLLLPYNFVRSHHSYLINLNQVVEVKKNDGGSLIMTDKSQLPISARKRAMILEEIKRVFIG